MKGYIINVKDFDLDKRKRVQDAFFKLGLGFKWASDDGYEYLDKKYLTYGNINDSGEIYKHLMWGKSVPSKEEKPYEITYEQLMEEAFGNTYETSEETSLSSRVHTIAEEFSLDYNYYSNSKSFEITYRDLEYPIDSLIKLDKLKQLIELDKELLGE